MVGLAFEVAHDDKEFASRLPVGATGEAAIFTDHVRVTHITRKIILRELSQVLLVRQRPGRNRGWTKSANRIISCVTVRGRMAVQMSCFSAARRKL
jgi:hypothetical protein